MYLIGAWRGGRYVSRRCVVLFDWQVRSLLSSTNLASLSPISIHYLYCSDATCACMREASYFWEKTHQHKSGFTVVFTDAADSVAPAAMSDKCNMLCFTRHCKIDQP